MCLCICEGETVTSREGILWGTQLRLTKPLRVLRLLRFGLGSLMFFGRNHFQTFAQIANASILSTDALVSLLQFCSKPFLFISCSFLFCLFHGSLRCPPHSRYKQFKSCWAHSARPAIPAMISYDQLRGHYPSDSIRVTIKDQSFEVSKCPFTDTAAN